MKTSIIPGVRDDIPDDSASWLDRFARWLVHNQLSLLEHGEVVIRERDSETYFGRPSSEFPLPVRIEVSHPGAWSDLAFGGSSGSGEAYIKGYWRCSNLTGLVRIFLRNRHVLDTMDYRLTRLRGPVNRILHALSRNTHKGSRRNIGAHYDLGNELFALFLDPTMMYSCAFYADPDTGLDAAAVAKLDRVCRKLDLKPGDHLLEIGTGWGGLAIHAAKHYGCRVTTTTISRQQFEYAQERVRAEGLGHRVTLLFQDYRDLAGSYDKLVSIEMIEAIGHQYLDNFFGKCNSLLKPDGVMLLQAITIADNRYERAVRQVDFIKKYIFPGGFLPSVSVMCGSFARASDLKLFHMEDIGPHYARTLRDWRRRFFSRIDEVRGLGYSEAFIRMWDYYLCYCEGGFIERDIGTVQMLLTKPGYRCDQIVVWP